MDLKVLVLLLVMFFISIEAKRGGRGSERGVRHRGPEISGDEEGDPIWKPSNTNRTGGGAKQQRILN